MQKDLTIVQSRVVEKFLTAKIITYLIIFFIVFKPLS